MHSDLSVWLSNFNLERNPDFKKKPMSAILAEFDLGAHIRRMSNKNENIDRTL